MGCVFGFVCVLVTWFGLLIVAGCLWLVVCVICLVVLFRVLFI